jgi:asparagine synthase (glutamine-hydrolysing)
MLYALCSMPGSYRDEWKKLGTHMCGIAGIVHFHEPLQPETIRRMTGALRHRGPDDEGFLAANLEKGRGVPLLGSESMLKGPEIETFREPVNAFLGHRRLSIIDLSTSGHGPMSNEDGSVWISYNGEIYNYQDLRSQLEGLGHRFQSRTDTEVALHAYEAWGWDCLSRFNGMWAFALLDLKTKRLFCARDRAGVKPFYYRYDGKSFCFASEIKSLLTVNGFQAVPNEQMVADYLLSGLLDHTQGTFFRGIDQLRPGHYLMLEDGQIRIQPYWDLEAKEDCFERNEEVEEHFQELLRDSVRLRLRSDVPVGTCLSGGLDSSTIVCLANQLMFNGATIDPILVGERQKTFSSCSEIPGYDERPYIEEVVRQSGAEKNCVFPGAETLLHDLRNLIWYQEEPFGSTSVYAQWCVMRLAREKRVTVLLDGQGGDELLAGYPPALYPRLRQALREGRLLSLMEEIQGLWHRRETLPDRLLMKALIAAAPSGLKAPLRKWTGYGTDWMDEGFQKRHSRVLVSPRKFPHDLDNYLYQIFRETILPSLLHYEDRNSMAFSLEARLPFLDYRLVEFAFSLPVEQKIRSGVSKVILRNSMRGILPETVRTRKDKMGFVTPEAIWFRTALRDTIKEIIDSKSFSDRGYFNVREVKDAFKRHCEGKIDISATIWRWVNLELWCRTFVDQRPSLAA